MRTYHGFNIATTLALLMQLGCSGSSSNTDLSSKTVTPALNSASTSMELNACTLLQSIGLEQIIGEATGDITPIMHMENEGRVVSQCDVGTSSPERSVGLFIKYSPGESVPKTKAAVISSESNADILGLGEETAAAIRNGKDITALGDLAFTYDLIGFNLMVYWNKHYQMVVMPRGLGDKEEDIAREVAKRVIKAVK